MARQYKASVKVMRSYDYCHFEVTLGSDELQGLSAINRMRQKAAVLVDEAVRQYRIAKSKENRRFNNEWKLEDMLRRVKAIEAKPESERTPEEVALLRAKDDAEFWRAYEEDDYCYGFDDEREHHFSMLSKYKKTVVRGAALSQQPERKE